MEAAHGSDHDLLIRIDEKIRFMEEVTSRHSLEHQKALSSIVAKLESKADKGDIHDLQKSIIGLDTRVKNLENANAKEETQKQTIVQFGLGGIKVWQFVTGGIIFFLTVGSILVSLVGTLVSALK